MIRLNLVVIALFFVLGGQRAQALNSNSKDYSDRTHYDGRRYMGRIFDRPKHIWTKVFELNAEDTSDSFFLKIDMFQKDREAGLADPSRPGGPDNRKIVTETSFDITVSSKTGKQVFVKDLPGSMAGLVRNLKGTDSLGGDSKGDVEFAGPNYDKDFVSWAKRVHNVSAVKSSGD